MRFLLLLVLLGCTPKEVADIASTDVFYRRDVRITLGDRVWTGVAVLPQQSLYRLSLEFAGNLDLFTFTDCHAQWTKEKAGTGGIFGPKNEVDFNYRPSFADETYCPVELGGYEAIKGRHAWGFIDFKTSIETAPADLECNGERQSNIGVSVCQSLTGLIQRVTFLEPMEVVPPEGCGLPISDDQKTFEFPMNAGRCVYAFLEYEGNHRIHRLTTLGYDKILIREVRP